MPKVVETLGIFYLTMKSYTLNEQELTYVLGRLLEKEQEDYALLEYFDKCLAEYRARVLTTYKDETITNR